MYTFTHTRTHTHTHIRIHTHTFTHTCTKFALLIRLSNTRSFEVGLESRWISECSTQKNLLVQRAYHFLSFFLSFSLTHINTETHCLFPLSLSLSLLPSHINTETHSLFPLSISLSHSLSLTQTRITFYFSSLSQPFSLSFFHSITHTHKHALSLAHFTHTHSLSFSLSLLFSFQLSQQCCSLSRSSSLLSPSFSTSAKEWRRRHRRRRRRFFVWSFIVSLTATRETVLIGNWIEKRTLRSKRIKFTWTQR